MNFFRYKMMNNYNRLSLFEESSLFFKAKNSSDMKIVYKSKLLYIKGPIVSIWHEQIYHRIDCKAYWAKNLLFCFNL